MICKCGADMRHQSIGVYFCDKGDRFAVVIGQQAQWFSAEGEPEPYLPEEHTIPLIAFQRFPSKQEDLFRRR